MQANALLALQRGDEDLSVAEKARRLGVGEARYLALNKRLHRLARRIAKELQT